MTITLLGLYSQRKLESYRTICEHIQRLTESHGDSSSDSNETRKWNLRRQETMQDERVLSFYIVSTHLWMRRKPCAKSISNNPILNFTCSFSFAKIDAPQF